MPNIAEYIENDITLGEICNTRRVVWDEYVAEVLDFGDETKIIMEN